MDLILNVAIRKQKGIKLSSLRNSGKIPGVFYGFKVNNMPIELDYGEFEKIYNLAGENTVIKLNIKDAENVENNNVLIYSVDKDPVNDRITHIDLYAIRMDKKIRVETPLVFEGVSGAVKNFGGVVVRHLNELEVEALPSHVPHEIKVDISVLNNIDDIIRVGDIIAPEGVKIMNNPDVVVVAVEKPRAAEEEIKPEGAESEKESVGDVKVVRKEKEESEEEGKDDDEKSGK